MHRTQPNRVKLMDDTANEMLVGCGEGGVCVWTYDAWEVWVRITNPTPALANKGHLLGHLMELKGKRLFDAKFAADPVEMRIVGDSD